MNPAVFLGCLTLAFTSCASGPSGAGSRSGARGEAGSHDVPEEVINALPERILGGKLQAGTTPIEYMNQLGLGPWIDNLSPEQKYDSYFVYLNTTYMLQIRCHPDSLELTDQDAQAIQAGYELSSSPLWLKDPVVIGATLRKDWQEILVHRIY